MQRFQEPTETTTPAAPVYDSETVREVLARAAQIEQEKQADAPLTAEQIETLGLELGLSPDAVRRSLGEKVGTVAPVKTAITATTQTEPLTRAQLVWGFAPMLIHIVASYLFLSFWVTLPQSRLENVSSIGNFLIIAFGTVPYLLSAYAGWTTKRVRLSVIGAIYLPLFFYLVLNVMSAASGYNIAWNIMFSV
ncbi:MAG: hypothetical protein H7Y38_00600, partial [Armatimonadetes bacterium]|nr:hypothetical protein [Armatimonadota bacterium]